MRPWALRAQMAILCQARVRDAYDSVPADLDDVVARVDLQPPSALWTPAGRRPARRGLGGHPGAGARPGGGRDRPDRGGERERWPAGHGRGKPWPRRARGAEIANFACVLVEGAGCTGNGAERDADKLMFTSHAGRDRGLITAVNSRSPGRPGSVTACAARGVWKPAAYAAAARRSGLLCSAPGCPTPLAVDARRRQAPPRAEQALARLVAMWSTLPGGRAAIG